MKAFQNWYHVERPLDEEAHDAYEPRAEQEFDARLQGSEHRSPIPSQSNFPFVFYIERQKTDS